MEFLSRGAASFAPTALFVLLWSSGAIFSKSGLAQASSVVFLALRFGLALAVISLIAWKRGRWLPRVGTARQVALTGAVLVAGYSLFYLQALDAGVTPGLLATLLGLQPVLTLLLTERPLQARRLGGLALALAGVTLVVLDSLLLARLAPAGLLFAFAALACITAGTLMQKRLQQAPLDVLPLQYAVACTVFALLLLVSPLRVEWSAELAVSVGWLGLVISVAATLLLYRLLQAGNLVDVTSLFYLVPAGTAVLDWLLLGNAMAPAALCGTAAILAGVIIVTRSCRVAGGTPGR
ncbi:DMT family transporter [Ramlibacter sp. USB13]|uniref:DMT family transporter n=1 Tax=Ramlibacter cellulosilyticus TaxID=2764187 RepID=A0A923MTG7_9BURK|nr:DMT family transporter [Ramlibacter cellulosilyticus]MBC5784943.1 DMT family transporter [Ramlibacter cellulosilyticus]